MCGFIGPDFNKTLCILKYVALYSRLYTKRNSIMVTEFQSCQMNWVGAEEGHQRLPALLFGLVCNIDTVLKLTSPEMRKNVLSSNKPVHLKSL